MPDIPEALFIKMVRKFVWVEQTWIPSGEGGRLYIRPFMFASGTSVRFEVSDEYIFCILVSPAKAFFNSSVLNIYIEPNLREHMRRTGSANAAAIMLLPFPPM